MEEIFPSYYHEIKNIKKIVGFFGSVGNDRLISFLSRKECQKLEKIEFLKHKNIDLNYLTTKSLTNLSLLKNLVIDTCDVVNIEPLRMLKKLVYLECPRNQITSLEPLRKLKDLEYLGFSYNYVTSLEPLSSLTKIQHLSFEKNNVSSLIPLISLCNLRWISVGRCKFKSWKGVPENVNYLVLENYYEYWYVLENIKELSGTSKFRLIKEILEKKEISWISWINIFDLNKLYDFF